MWHRSRKLRERNKIEGVYLDKNFYGTAIQRVWLGNLGVVRMLQLGIWVPLSEGGIYSLTTPPWGNYTGTCEHKFFNWGATPREENRVWWFSLCL